MQALTDVPHVGQPTLAVSLAEQPGPQTAFGGGRLKDGGDSSTGQQRAPAAEQRGQFVGRLLTAGGKPGDAPPEERRAGGRPDERSPVRLFQRLQQGQPVLAGVGGVDTSRTRHHGRNLQRRKA